MTSIAQEYLLLLLDDETGSPQIAGSLLSFGVTGAVLCDLALAGRIDVTGGGGLFQSQTVRVLSAAPTGDEAADATLRELAEKPRTPYVYLNSRARQVRVRVLDQLVSAGILRREEGRILGFFPRTTWPATSTRLEQETRGGLRRVLVVGTAPSGHQAALIELLAVTNGLRKALPDEERGTVRAGAKRLAATDWTPPEARAMTKAVVRAIRSLMSSQHATNAGIGG